MDRFKAATLKRTSREGRCLLLDISGSMGEMVNEEMRRIDILREASAQFPNETQYIFSSDVEELQHPSQLMPTGGTYMSKAFAFAKAKEKHHVILVSDGEPMDDENDVLRAAAGLKVDIIFCGRKGEEPEFLKKLAGATNGSFSVSLEEPLALAEAIQKFLPAGN